MSSTASPPTGSAPRDRVIVLGAGGHARVVIASVRRAKRLAIVGVLDADLLRRGERIDDATIVGGDELLESYAATVDGFVCAIGGAASNAVRAAAFGRACDAGLTPRSVVDPTAVVDDAASLARGCYVGVLAVVQPGATLGENVIVNTRAVVEHDAEVGAHAHVCPGAVVLGGASIADHAFVGAGAVVLPGVSVGRGAVVGAGAVVTKPIGEGETVVGTPARLFEGGARRG